MATPAATTTAPVAARGPGYRETTPVMVARVTAALDERIDRALAVAAYMLREGRDSRAVDGREDR